MTVFKQVTFVNLRGDPVNVDPAPAAQRKSRREATAFHKGWRVVGVSPESLSIARAAHDKEGGTGRFDDLAFALKARLTPVRNEPFYAYDAALECVRLAARCGWLCAHPVELSKGVA